LNPLFLAPIVEGHGEVEAVPALLHRIARQLAPESTLRVNPPIRVKSGSFLNDESYFRKQVTLAAAKAAQSRGWVLILLDCEDDGPATVGPDLLRRARVVRSDMDVLVVLAHREYETWFVTAARSLRGMRGLISDLEAPPRPEAMRDAKGWLSARMEQPYDEITHQIEFTRRFDLNLARTNRSFDRLCRHIRDLLTLSAER
jgi:hypothetical protein